MYLCHSDLPKLYIVLLRYRIQINQYQYQYQLQITLSNVTLGEVESTRCLGVIVDNKLSFDQHINNVVRKASRKIGVLRRSFRQMNLFARRTFVVGVIQPDLEYALPVCLSFISAKNRNKLASLHPKLISRHFFTTSMFPLSNIDQYFCSLYSFSTVTVLNRLFACSPSFPSVRLPELLAAQQLIT